MASVNRPTDPRQKEQNINQKLQLYGIYSAFANGKVPTNRQIDVALNSLLASRALAKPSSKLSHEGQELVADLRDVIEKAKILLLTKNEGNLIQDFIWQCQHIDGGNAGLPNAPVDKDTAKQHGSQALDGLRTLGTLIISNGQFRKLLSDALVLFRDIAGDGAQKAASKLKPDQEQLDNLDEPAPENTWHDTPDTGGIKNQLKSKFDQAKGTAQNVKQDAQSNADQSGDTRQSASQGAKAGLSSLKNNASGMVDDDTKEKAKQSARDTRDATKDYLKEKMPQERRDQTVMRMKKMIVEIQGHQDYQQAIDTLLRLASQYKGHTKNISQQTAGAAKAAHSDNSLQAAEADLKILLERFANSTSLDDLMDAINAMYHDADQDPELKGWFRHLNTYIQKCLKEQGYVMRDSATDEWNKLYDQGNFLLRDRYRNHTNRVGDELKFLADQYDADPQNTAFANALKKLFTDLGNDENGKPTFKPHLIKDLTNVILPAFFENIRYIPIPRVEYSDSMNDAAVENLIIESDNLTPNKIEVENFNRFSIGRKGFATTTKHLIAIRVSGVQMDLKDVSFWLHKKSGFPTFTGKGLVDIFLGGTGFSFDMALETADASDRSHLFKIAKRNGKDDLNVEIKHMNVKLKKFNHPFLKLLFGMSKPLLFGVMMPVVTKILEKIIKDQVQKADAYLHDIQLEVQRAAKEAANNPDQAQNIYQRYLSAAQKKYTSGKQKTKEAAADKQVNVAVTQQDSMFKNVALPGGISTKATEFKEMAAKGEKWESPIFTIGSAKETTNLPKVAAVSRKPHSTTQSALRDKKDAQHSDTSNTASYSQSQPTNNYGKSQSAGNYGYAQYSDNYDGASSGGNYAQGHYDSQNGYGTQGGYGSQSGYGHQGSYGYQQGAGDYDGQPNGAAGFSNQVNKAFSGETGGKDPYSLTNADPGFSEYTGSTSLGAANPVLQGRI